MTHLLAIGEIEPQRDSSVSDWALARLHNHPTPPPRTHACTHTHMLIHRDQGKREGKEETGGLTGLKF